MQAGVELDGTDEPEVLQEITVPGYCIAKVILFEQWYVSKTAGSDECCAMR